MVDYPYPRQDISSQTAVEQPTVQSKTCRACLEYLPLSHFGTIKNSKDGHRHICKACRSQQNMIEWTTKYGRNKPVDLGPIRSVTMQNQIVLKQALASKQFTCIGFVPRTDRVYTVIFGDAKYSVNSMALYTRDGSIYKAFEYSGGDPAVSIAQIKQILKCEKIRLELSEVDMINAKSQIYYL